MGELKGQPPRLLSHWITPDGLLLYPLSACKVIAHIEDHILSVHQFVNRQRGGDSGS
jgi:hypothetical protein